MIALNTFDNCHVCRHQEVSCLRKFRENVTPRYRTDLDGSSDYISEVARQVEGSWLQLHWNFNSYSYSYSYNYCKNKKSSEDCRFSISSFLILMFSNLISFEQILLSLD